MPDTPSNPSWIEPPPKKGGGLGCAGKGCLGFAVLVVLVFLMLGITSYLMVSHGSKPVALPVKEITPQALADVRQRVEEFKSTPPAPLPSPTATAGPEQAPEPTPASPVATPGRQLVVTAGEINGMISANPKSRGHAYVSLSGNTATVQISIPSNKVPGFPAGYLNGAFTIATDGPTPISALQVSKIRANGVPVPSGVLSMSYRGESILGIALDAIAPYHVSNAEIRDGAVVLH